MILASYHEVFPQEKWKTVSKQRDMQNFRQFICNSLKLYTAQVFFKW